MKRIVSLVAFLCAMTWSVQAQGLKFGVKGGLNISKMSFSKDVFDSDNKTGFYVGPTIKLSLPLGFGLDIAALYDQRSTDVKTDAKPSGTTVAVYAGDEKITQKSIQIPVNLRYNIGLAASAGIYLAAGPQFGFPVGDKVYNTNMDGEFNVPELTEN